MAELDGRRVVIIHGWSDQWESMQRVGEPLEEAGADVRYIDYDSREDRAFYEDFAEGLHRQVCDDRGNPRTGDDGQVHFVTHSTGALVLRQWLKQYGCGEDGAVGNIVFLAPPNFGSPLAHKGRSLIGKIFKGQHDAGDRFEVGEHVLRGLELASPLQWELAEFDLLGERGSLYHAHGVRGAVITGCAGYGGLRQFVNEVGTDGTIVVAGANLNVRRLELDFARGPDGGDHWSKWSGFDVHERPREGVIPPNLPFAIHRDLTHASILDLAGNPVLKRQVVDALAAGPGDYRELQAGFRRFTKAQVGRKWDRRWQQLVFRLRDDRGMPVNDYHLEFNVWRADRLQESYPGGPLHIPAGEVQDEEEARRSGKLDRLLAENLHGHSRDPSYKRYLLRPDEVTRKIVTRGYVATLRIDADAGDRDIFYRTAALDNVLVFHSEPGFHRIRPFYPNTTTLVDVRIDRGSRLVELCP